MDVGRLSVGAEIQELLAALMKEEEEEEDDVVARARRGQRERGEGRIAQSFHSAAFLYRAKVIDDIRRASRRL